MSQGKYSLLTLTVIATANIPAQRFVRYDGAMCGVGDNAIGVSFALSSVGEPMAVDVEGAVPMIAAGAINVGDEVQSDANGSPIARTTGVRLGRAMQSAIAGEVVQIRLLQN